jgi:hypothetical protein
MTRSAGVRPFTAISYLEGLAQYLGKDTTVYYERGIPSLGEMADATVFASDEAGAHTAFSYYDTVNHERTADQGNFSIKVGHSAGQIDLTGSVTRSIP